MAFPSPSPLTPVPGPALVRNGKAELDPEGGDSPLLLGSDSSVEVAKLRLKGTLSSKFLEKLLSKVQGRGKVGEDAGQEGENMRSSSQRSTF